MSYKKEDQKFILSNAQYIKDTINSNYLSKRYYKLTIHSAMIQYSLNSPVGDAGFSSYQKRIIRLNQDLDE